MKTRVVPWGRIRWLAIASVVMAGTAAFAETITVASGETMKLDATTNLDDNEIRLEDGATLAVPADNSNYDYYVHPKIRVAGAARLTADPHPADPDRYTLRFLSSIVAVDDNCSLTVSNSIRRIYFGITGSKYAVDGTEVHYPFISLKNLLFEDEHEDGGFVFRDTGACTIVKLPDTCRFDFYDNTGNYTLAVKGADALAPLGLSNPYRIDRFNVVLLDREAIPPGSTVQVADGHVLAIKPCSVNTTSCTWTGNMQSFSLDVDLEGPNSLLLFRHINAATMIFDGNVTGRGCVYARGEKSSSTCNLALIGNIACDGGLQTGSRANVHFGPGAWRIKVKSWFDASDTNTFVKLTAEPPAGRTNLVGDESHGYFETVVGWRDKVKGTNDVVCYNTRLWKGGKSAKDDYVLEVLPYIVPNGPNGLPYLCFGNCGGKVANAGWGKSANSTEARRLPFWRGELDGANKAAGAYAKYAYKYAIMVFGSQQGGGGALLGADSQKLARLTSAADPWIGSNASLYDSLYVDGVQADPGADTPNGGWQIVSIDLSGSGPNVNALGARHCADNDGSTVAGGQNYGEVILFDSVPTESERLACERYLAEKWGLAASYAGASFESSVRLNSANASATLTVRGSVELAGDWTGTLNLADDAVVSLVHNPPPSAADLPAAGRVGWWDPDFDATLVMCQNAARPLELNGVLCRTLDGVDSTVAWFGGSRNASGEYNRSPWINEGARGNGPSRRWVDFTDKYDREMTNVVAYAGNTLRLRAYPFTEAKMSKTTASDSSPISIRQAFLVMDTSKGGGTPLMDTVNASGTVRARYGTKFPGDTWSRPIHVSGSRTTGGVFTNGKAWIDKTEVDPYVAGFNGMPEVLTLETTGDFPATFLGYYGGGNESKAGIDNYEIMGEVLFYSAPLSDADRATVQDYLMHKWFGHIANPAYSDLSRARITGVGTLVAGMTDSLPDLSGFTGTFVVTNACLSFTVGSPVELSCEVSLPDGAAITVNIPEHVENGTYPLLSATSVTGGEGATFSLAGAQAGKYSADFLHEANGLSVRLSHPNMMIIFR